MPNLGMVLDDVEELRRSLDPMTGTDYPRGHVRINHGIRNVVELQARVCQPPFDAGDVEAIQAVDHMIRAAPAIPASPGRSRARRPWKPTRSLRPSGVALRITSMHSAAGSPCRA